MMACSAPQNPPPPSGGLYEIEEDARVARKKHPQWDDASWHAFRHEPRLNRSRPILDAIHPGSWPSGPECSPRGRSARRSVTR